MVLAGSRLGFLFDLLTPIQWGYSFALIGSFPVLTARTVVHAAVGGVVAVVLAACSGDSPSTAATVNGTDIAASEVDAQVEILADSPQAQQQYQGVDEEQRDKQLRADVLSQFIFEVILQDGAEELGVEVTEDDLAETRTEIAAQFGGDEEAMYTQLEEQGLDREEVDRQLQMVALQEAMIAELGPEVSDDDVQAAYDAGAPARHILVEDEQQARDVIDRLEDGEEFAAVAQETSTDGSAQQGGDLGFVQPGTTVPEFEEALFAAEEGEIVGPTQSEFGFHVIQRMEKPALTEVEDDLRAQLDQQNMQEGQTAFQEFFTQRMQEAEVEVASGYGEWDAEQGRVVSDDPIQPDQPEQPLPEQPEDGEGGEGSGSGDGTQSDR